MTKPLLWSRIKDRDTLYAVKEVADAIPVYQVPQAGFRAFRSQALTLPNPATGWNKVIFDSVEFDVEGEYQLSNGFFVPKHAGQYMVSTGAYILTAIPAGAQIGIAIYKNGNQERLLTYEGQSPARSGLQIGGSDVFNVLYGDQFDVRIYTNINGLQIYPGGIYTWFSSMLMRQVS